MKISWFGDVAKNSPGIVPCQRSMFYEDMKRAIKSRWWRWEGENLVAIYYCLDMRPMSHRLESV
jgi:hypothetical protein